MRGVNGVGKPLYGNTYTFDTIFRNFTHDAEKKCIFGEQIFRFGK